MLVHSQQSYIQSHLTPRNPILAPTNIVLQNSNKGNENTLTVNQEIQHDLPIYNNNWRILDLYLVDEDLAPRTPRDLSKTHSLKNYSHLGSLGS